MPGIAVIALFATVLPSAVVLQPVANMYSRASEDADVVSQAIYGANVGLVEQKDGWAHIRTADDYTGWTPLGALRPGGPMPSRAAWRKYSSLFAHIYREASVTKHAPADHGAVRSAARSRGEPKTSTLAARCACPTTAPAGCRRATSRFDPKPLSIAGNAGVQQAVPGPALHLGRHFELTATTAPASSQMLERRRGVNMPRDAQPQADWSGVAAVDRKDLQPGDLLYFGSSDKHITHTGMYLGDGKFINATTHETPMVRIDDLNEPHWTQAAGGRRGE